MLRPISHMLLPPSSFLHRLRVFFSLFDKYFLSISPDFWFLATAWLML